MGGKELVKKLEQESVKGLDLYIKAMHTQDECVGYMHAFDEAIELVKRLTLADVILTKKK